MMRDRTLSVLILASVALAVFAAVAGVAPGARAADYGLRGYAVYYNDMKDLTTVYFRQNTSETTYIGSNSWMLRNPNASGGTSIVLVTDDADGISTYGNVGVTIPPQGTLSGNDYRNSVKLYASASTAVELYFESAE